MAWAGGLLLVSGCALPDYHLPHGFSSTYYRHLQQGSPVVFPAPVPIAPANNEANLPRSYQPTPPGPNGPAT